MKNIIFSMPKDLIFSVSQRMKAVLPITTIPRLEAAIKITRLIPDECAVGLVGARGGRVNKRVTALAAALASWLAGFVAAFPMAASSRWSDGDVNYTTFFL